MNVTSSSFYYKYLFPDRINCKFTVALPNIAWVCDLTLLDTELFFRIKGRGYKRFYAQLFFVLDLASGEILLSKPFFHVFGPYWNGKIVKYKPVKPTLISKLLEKLVSGFNKKPETTLPFKYLIIHSDRGPEFVSKSWNKLFKKYDFLRGSMCPSFSSNF